MSEDIKIPEPEYIDSTYGEDLQPFLDAEYLLTSEEIQYIDRNVYEVVMWEEIAQRHFPSIPIPAGIKEFKMDLRVEMDPPIFTDDFLTEDIDEARKKRATFYPIMMHKDFVLKKTDIDSARSTNIANLDPKTLQIQGAASTIVNYRERCLWRGYDIMGRSAANTQGSIDTASKGIMNADPFQSGSAAVTTFQAGADADDNITAAGDGSASVGAAIAALLAYKHVGPYKFFTTPLAKAQLVNNFNTTTNLTDLERMLSMVDERKNLILSDIDITPFLINATETTSTGAMVCIDPKTKMNTPTVAIGEQYPVTHYPMDSNPLYIKGKIIWGGIPLVLYPDAVAIAEAITT